jgi:RNA polymerase sigma-70 factor (ECF subfamily)
MKSKFYAFVNNYEDQVFSLALYMLRDRGEAEDVAQESYLKLWQHIDDIDDDRAKLWLLKVTRNGCIDRLRKKRQASNVSETALEIVDKSKGPAGTLAHEQLSKWLKDAIELLQEPYRSLIVLRDVQQKSYGDVAVDLSLSLSQVKVYLHRARAQPRDILREIEL